MNKALKTILLSLPMLLLAVAMQAQNYRSNNQGNKKRPNREQLAKIQAQHIVDELAMDESVASRFVNTYCSFQKELWALGPRIKSASKQSGTQSDNKVAEQTIKQRFERSQKILELREKYYAEYSKFLSQRQIKRVYEIERKMMKRLSNRKQVRKR